VAGGLVALALAACQSSQPATATPRATESAATVAVATSPAPRYAAY
jgi:hypothetical protein